MPRLSDSMEEGTIVRWLRRDGEQVRAGEEIVEIETDKATIGYEAELSGLLQVLAEAGQTLPVGALIARIGDASQHASHHNSQHTSRHDGADPSPKRRVRASPLARRLAHELGIDLHALVATGPSGRIVKRDVLAASAGNAGGRALSAQDASAPTPAARSAAAAGVELGAPAASAPPAARQAQRRRPSPTQATIARRMSEAAAVPVFTLSTEVEMDAAVALRAELTELDEQRRPSLNDFVVRASALALRRHPIVNASYRDAEFELYSRVNIGIAVAATDALLVPTVFDADSKSLAQIALETRELAEQARSGRLTPQQLSGATFTISNLGMYGVTEFTAVINPPQAAILAVGALVQRLQLRDGTVTPVQSLSLTLTCDHRILYGADAAAFLQDVRAHLERPLRLAF